MSPHPTYNTAVIPGDGIGPEVIHAGVRALETLAATLQTFRFRFTYFEWGSEYYGREGRYLPDDALEVVRGFDAIYFGAVGAPDIPDHLSLWGLRLALVQPLQQYANVCPTRLLRGTTSPLTQPQSLDMLIIRENSEGEYAGQGGRSHVSLPWEVGTELAIFTRHGMVLWDEIAAEIAAEYPSVTMEKMLVDAMTARMVLQPGSVDTVVATNLHADILSDLAAALAGSIGIAPTANLDPSRKNPSLFEPIHGSAFDLVGKGSANPVGALWTAAEMMRWLGEEVAADGFMICVENVLERGVKTRDLGGTSGTVEVTTAVCEEIGKVLGR